jgi:hypothetical protein
VDQLFSETLTREVLGEHLEILQKDKNRAIKEEAGVQVLWLGGSVCSVVASVVVDGVKYLQAKHTMSILVWA